MSGNPYMVSTRVLDAAAAGVTLPGYAAVGNLLVDLGRTTPLRPGVALRSSAVAAATSASRRGVRPVAARWLKPVVVVVAVAAVGLAAFVAAGRAASPTVPDVGSDSPAPGRDSGVERVVSDDNDDEAPTDDEAQTDDATVPSSSTSSSATSTAPGGNGGSVLSSPSPTIAAPTPTVTTNEPSEEPTSTTTNEPSEETTSTTTNGPSEETTSTTTTMVPITPIEGGGELPEEQGNNGNGNGNGVGNGKGNSGDGKGNRPPGGG